MIIVVQSVFVQRREIALKGSDNDTTSQRTPRMYALFL